VEVGDVDGVRVAGLLLEAGAVKSKCLLCWGSGSYAGSATNPGFIHDLFTRIGPTDMSASAEAMVHVNSGHVVGDDLWLWRPDHTSAGSTPYLQLPVDNGLVVNGDDVTMYGLASEHTLKDLTVWNGERGETYFYQSELPYDVTQADYGAPGYVGYRVNDAVTTHKAYGVGVYHYFKDYPVVTYTGIRCPSGMETSFISPLVVLLNGYGTVTHIINDQGASTSPASGAGAAVWWCGFSNTSIVV
jgi:hypothetical protein